MRMKRQLSRPLQDISHPRRKAGGNPTLNQVHLHQWTSHRLQHRHTQLTHWTTLRALEHHEQVLCQLSRDYDEFNQGPCACYSLVEKRQSRVTFEAAIKEADPQGM